MPASADDPVDTAARGLADQGRRLGGRRRRGRRLARGEHEERDEQAHAEHARLTAQVAALQAELAPYGPSTATELEQAKADHKVLRQRLGEARGVLRAAEQARDEATPPGTRPGRRCGRDPHRRGRRTTTARASWTRPRPASPPAGARRGPTEDTASIRARLLLDAVVDAATGLRRELALPAVGGAPGDAVEAALAGVDAAPSSSAPATPALLEQTLALPRARL